MELEKKRGTQVTIIATPEESTVLACSYQATTDKFSLIYLDRIVKWLNCGEKARNQTD